MKRSQLLLTIVVGSSIINFLLLIYGRNLIMLSFNKEIFKSKLSLFNTNELEFAFKLYYETVSSNDFLGAIIRIDLICESILEAWVCAVCSQPELFKQAKHSNGFIMFGHKAILAENTGLDSDVIKIFNRVNQIRNNFAHNPFIQDDVSREIETPMTSIKSHFDNIKNKMKKQYRVDWDSENAFVKLHDKELELHKYGSLSDAEKIILVVFLIIIFISREVKLLEG